MHNNNKLISLAGIANSGKNFFADQIKKYSDKNVIILSLADALKKDLQPFILEKFGIDILNCTREEKNLVRPLLVSFGGINRQLSKGTCYTKIIGEQIKDIKDSVIILSDLRYIQWETDEYFWVKNHGGKLIYIERAGIDYPNEDERINCPKLKAVADFVFEPPYFTPENENECEEYFRGVLKQILV